MIASAPVLTNSGKSLLMRAIAGEQITFTRFKVGSGTLPAGRSIADLTDLISTKVTFPVSNVDDTQSGFISIAGEFSSDDVTADFVWRELGIFAKGEDNTEVLYAYSNDGSNASTIRKINSSVQTKQTVTMILAVGEAANISVDYTPQEVPQTVLAISCGTVSSLPKTVSNAKITSDMVVIKSVLSNPSAQQGDWTVTTATGTLTISGSIAGNTGVTLYLARTIS